MGALTSSKFWGKMEKKIIIPSIIKISFFDQFGTIFDFSVKYSIQFENRIIRRTTFFTQILTKTCSIVRIRNISEGGGGFKYVTRKFILGRSIMLSSFQCYKAPGQNFWWPVSSPPKILKTFFKLIPKLKFQK